MSSPVVIDATRLPDGSGWSLQKGVDPDSGAYRYYFFGAGELDDDHLEYYEVRWVDFDLDEDFRDRFAIDSDDFDEIAAQLGVDVSADAHSGDPVRIARFIRAVIDYRGEEEVDDLPESWEYQDMVRTFPDLFGVAAAPASMGVDDELAQINAHRRALGMHPLDPDEAGWSDDDVIAEARRLRGNPRERLLSW